MRAKERQDEAICQTAAGGTEIRGKRVSENEGGWMGLPFHLD